MGQSEELLIFLDWLIINSGGHVCPIRSPFCMRKSNP